MRFMSWKAEMVDRRAKRNEILDFGTLVTHIWGIFHIVTVVAKVILN